MRLLLPAIAALLLVAAGCTCNSRVETIAGPDVPRADVRIPLAHASEAMREAITAQLAEEGAFGGGDGPVAQPCVHRRVWAVEGDEATHLQVDIEATSDDCSSPAVSGRASLHRELLTRPDTRIPPGGGFRAPRMAFIQTWHGLGWRQAWETWGVRQADPWVVPGSSWADRVLPEGVVRTELPRDLTVSRWSWPPWVFGRSTYRVWLDVHACDEGGPSATWLVLSRRGDDDAYIPGPSRQAIDRIIAALDDAVVPVHAPDATRCTASSPVDR